MLKRILITIGLVCMLLGLALLGLILYIENIENIQESNGRELYAYVQSALLEYPKLSEPFGFTKFYYCDGITEYMLLRNGDKQITGVRSENDEAIYYMNGKSWELKEAGLVEKDAVEDPIQAVIADKVRDLLADEELSYSYHEARRLTLPIWVYTGETYIQCERAKYPGHVEVMVYDELDYGKYLRWNIARSSEDVVLFLWVRENMLKPDTDDSIYITGWGEIEQEIVNALYE